MEKKKLEADYFLGRVNLINKLKPFRKTLEKIGLKGIETEEDERVAKIACSILASDYIYEESLLKSRRGNYRPFITPPDKQ